VDKEIESISIGKDVEPITDTQPPLVIDLPEGQKMVIGKLDPDAVIEVATWRGTGRPDSRTNRLMLGVSNHSTKPLETRIEQISTTQSIDAEEITSIEKIKTGYDHSYLSGHVVARTEINTESKNSRRFKRINKIAAVSALAIVFGLIMFGPLGLRFAHPNFGASTLVGQANNSIYAVLPNDEYKVGMSAISEVSTTSSGKMLGIISAVQGDNFVVSGDNQSYTVRKSELHGRVVAVLPFIGLVANLFNNG
jgi:hypothetical protein